eukprot:CAMPEP_0198369032 /NCGR_PEP_ID=MMETSP1450-20131203/156004_1 /TAXON_ID=753684 ORGANISM="Madagascaria erythrocladiodes, Strain CCMP3234" /NCGR_SAMPLE_ID=MMETSP1450 /ASSEMBLY_ACC=CAM_ASM_001115 /LENGTH=44 /DNA_ID= /DNA_START= /DNA_END= /DNA_ORIENTATION=
MAGRNLLHNADNPVQRVRTLHNSMRSVAEESNPGPIDVDYQGIL